MKTLVVLAAGIGSRYGGLKQIDTVGPSGESILDYSVYDALRAGFNKVVFVIRRDIEKAFRTAIVSRMERYIETGYVFQELADVPVGHSVPTERRKPWGTGHALLSAAGAVNTPFAVVNADDFYGAESYRLLAAFLDSTAKAPSHYAMVGYALRNTLSDHGPVARGICTVASDETLTGVVELTHIIRAGRGALCNDRALTGEEIVSVNLWGLKPSFFRHLQDEFRVFLRERGHDPHAEYYVPTVINTLIGRGVARCTVLTTPCGWVGVTYPADKVAVTSTIRTMILSGEYPQPLWGY